MAPSGVYSLCVAEARKLQRTALDGRMAGEHGSCQSRSTSAGSVARADLGDSPYSSSNAIAADEHVYDVLRCSVRNTFLDTPISRPMSLEGFLHEREIASCPVTRVHSLDHSAPLSGADSVLLSTLEPMEPSPPLASDVPPESAAASTSVVVQNTFIHAPLGRTLSLEGFFEERATRSCPATRHASFDDIGDVPETMESLLEGIEESSQASTDADFRSHAESGTGAHAHHVGDVQAIGRIELPPHADTDTHAQYGSDLHACYWQGDLADVPFESPIPALPPPPAEWAPDFATLSVPPPPPLRLSQVPPLELPSQGSAAHYTGECRPCAFLYTKGCSAGTQCNFCHACEAGEKKRRKHEKKEARRAMQEHSSMMEQTGVEMGRLALAMLDSIPLMTYGAPPAASAQLAPR